MGASSYFISDLHLDAARPQVTAALEDFLNARTDAHALYILGDLFEAWIGDDDDSELAAHVAQLLAQYQAAGPKLYLMHGNRDFLIGERFAARVGAQILDDPTVIDLNGERVLLMHGDSLCTRDVEYQEFRVRCRSPEWQRPLLDAPLEARRQIAQQLRQASKDAGSRKADDIMDVTESEVARVMREHDCRVLIHGHTHRPARHDMDVGTRWVLGDWEHLGWFIETTQDGIALEQFAIS